MRRLLSLSILAGFGSLCSWAGIDSGLLALVPSDVHAIASIDVTKSRNSEFGQYLLAKQRMDDQGFQEMIAQTGFDPRRDLQHLLLASVRAANNDGRHSSFAVIARGTFDEQRIAAAAIAKGAKIQNYQGVRVFVNGANTRQTAFAFLDTGVAAMADLPVLEQIIANRTTPVALNSDLQSRIEAVGSENDAWFVSLDHGGDLAEHILEEAGPQAQAIQSVTQSSGGIRFGQTIEASLQATARSPQDANALADVIRFLASMIQMRQDDPRAAILAPALNSMALSTTGNTVHVSLSIPEKSLEQLAELRPRHARMR
jgi:hypothetical protein